MTQSLIGNEVVNEPIEFNLEGPNVQINVCIDHETKKLIRDRLVWCIDTWLRSSISPNFTETKIPFKKLCDEIDKSVDRLALCIQYRVANDIDDFACDQFKKLFDDGFAENMPRVLEGLIDQTYKCVVDSPKATAKIHQ